MEERADVEEEILLATIFLEVVGRGERFSVAAGLPGEDTFLGLTGAVVGWLVVKSFQPHGPAGNGRSHEFLVSEILV